jgi:hypothetical protein
MESKKLWKWMENDDGFFARKYAGTRGCTGVIYTLPFGIGPEAIEIVRLYEPTIVTSRTSWICGS